VRIMRQQALGNIKIRSYKHQNCLQLHPGGRFLLKFMAVIHIAYATMKMPGPKGIITIKADLLDALAYENTRLSHIGCFAIGRHKIEWTE
jgi:hypothetical protein